LSKYGSDNFLKELVGRTVVETEDVISRLESLWKMREYNDSSNAPESVCYVQGDARPIGKSYSGDLEHVILPLHGGSSPSPASNRRHQHECKGTNERLLVGTNNGTSFPIHINFSIGTSVTEKWPGMVGTELYMLFICVESET
jgi:hypothetical protein